MSLPTRERGLKCKACCLRPDIPVVAPYAGAWIEILLLRMLCKVHNVAPYAEAWIEITPRMEIHYIRYVAPYAGAWIEIPLCQRQLLHKSRRSLRGSVD